MKVLLVADGRSPITRSWIKGLLDINHTVHLVSSYPCTAPEGISGIEILPLAFSQVGRSDQKGLMVSQPAPQKAKVIQRLRLLLLNLRYYLGPVSLSAARKRYLEQIEMVQPDLVQALRIPFEGMLASYTPKHIPVVINSWGNDFTLHARGSFFMEQMTKQALQRADGFCADCQRDIRIAYDRGLRQDTPVLFAPGNGGLDLAVMERMIMDNSDSIASREESYTVINPRGIRPAYVRNEIFFQAIPQVQAAVPQARFLCSSMNGQSDAEKWVAQYHLENSVTLLDNEPQSQLWQRYLSANVLVSPAIHDGTPNSVLEGMALGCLPVVGNIESLREWIKDEENGLLVDPNDYSSVAMGIIAGLMDRDLQHRARSINRQMVEELADRVKVKKNLDDFFREIMAKYRNK